jgi:hypothetical protein
VNWNYPVSATGSVRRSASAKPTGNAAKSAFLTALIVVASAAIYFGASNFATTVHAAEPSRPTPAAQSAMASQALAIPMFFEPNQGQTAPQVKFLARGAGYGLFLTANEAVLKLQKAIPATRTAAPIPQPEPPSVIRMRLEGANTSARVSGASPLPGRSNYFVGSDAAQWRSGIPQFARVEYQAVYPGIDLVYYGNQGQLEYDFRVAPGAHPEQIALTFTGATARIDTASGDLVLSTASGDVLFHAPHVYQPAGSSSGSTEKIVSASFRRLADNKVGFAVEDYDHRRQLVIDPVLSYSTYIGGGGESLVKIALDAANNIYLAGSTTSADFPSSTADYPTSVPIAPLSSTLASAGATNIFIAVLDPYLGPPQYPNTSYQLLYSAYLGGSGVDSLAGIQVDPSRNIYVAGSTTSSNFPTTTNAFQTQATVSGNGGFPGSHGFVSAITLGLNSDYTLTYSTYLAGNGVDTVTGLAIDSSCVTQSNVAACNAYVTGVTTSTNGPSNGFPANADAFQPQTNAPITGQAYPGNSQFFASKIYTSGTGAQSMLYSTYFGGGNFGATDIAYGGGIAVDTTSSDVNMYFTGTTNQLGVASASGAAAFPLYNAQQACLNESGVINCNNNNPSTTVDAFAAKIDPNNPGSLPVYSTYLGGSGDDYGYAIAVDSAANAYVAGATNSSYWACTCSGGFQPTYAGTGSNTNGFIAKIGAQVGSTYPLSYFTYLGGTGPDVINAISVDSLAAAHVVGTTSSPTGTFPVTYNTLQSQYGGPASDAFVALISTTLAGSYPLTTPAGDFSSYLGGSGTDQGTGVAVDVYGTTYAAGTTFSSTLFPISTAPFQAQLVGTQNAFATKVGASSVLGLTYPNTSPDPSPVAAGTQVAFTFNILNTGPDNANLVTFNALGIPTAGLTGSATAKVTQGTGSCGAVEVSTITCDIPSLAVNQSASVEVDMTPAVPITVNNPISISGNVSANGGLIQLTIPQPDVYVVDFALQANVLTPTVNAGDLATIQIKFCPTSNQGYYATITPSQTTSPSMVTANTPTFDPTTVHLAGISCGTTLLSIQTVARPVNSGSLLRHGGFYATWIPIAGLSLAGLGIAAGRKRRRWMLGGILCLLAAFLLLLPSCGSGSSSVPVNAGTAAGTYIVTIDGSAGTGASHSTQAQLIVH